MDDWGIYAVTEADILACSNCIWTSYMSEKAMNEIIEDMVTKVHNKTQASTIHISNVGCWWYGISIMDAGWLGNGWSQNGTGWHPCSPESCCKTTIPINPNTGIIMWDQSTVISSGNCDPNYPQCQPYCPFLNPYSPKIIINENNSNNSNNDYKTSIVQTTVYPNPSDGKIELKYNYPQNGNISLKIFNSIGGLVYEINKPKSSENDLISLNLSKLLAGNYNYILLFTIVR